MARAPFATWRPVPGPTDPTIRPIGVILHVDAGNAYSLYDWWLSPASQGIESHFHIAKDGHTEQYRDTTQEADANYKGNSFIRNGERVGFISVETQGYADGTWTPAQIDRIKQLLTWASSEHDFPLIVCPSPYDPGVGYHVMWGAPGDWTPTSKTCPGPNRIDQFRNIIVPWMEEDMQKIPMPDFVKKDIDYLKARGYFPAGVPSEEYYDMWRTYAYLARADKSLWNRMVDWTRDHVKTSIAAALAAGAGAGQIDYPELIRRIGEILAGG